MSTQTKIEWCDSTFNPWVGCTKISPACDNCYAKDKFDSRFHFVSWGAGQQRKRTSESTWKQPAMWNARADTFRECAGCGWRGDLALRDEPLAFACPSCDATDWMPARRRVFCASLADVFDNEVPTQWRTDLFDLISATPNLDWLLLTKRVGNVKQMLIDACRGFQHLPPWVWLGATITSQAEADRDVPKLLAVPAAVRFLSIEPMLGPVDIRFAFSDAGVIRCPRCMFGTNRLDHGPCPNDGETLRNDPGVHWVICGGESGPHARPMHPDWARSLRDQCAAAGVPFMFKQWGEWAPYDRSRFDGSMLATPNALDRPMQRFGKEYAGRLLDGRTWEQFP